MITIVVDTHIDTGKMHGLGRAGRSSRSDAEAVTARNISAFATDETRAVISSAYVFSSECDSGGCRLRICVPCIQGTDVLGEH